MKKILWVLAMFVAFTSMAFAAVNLNTATKDELDAVKGIGPAKAQAIIDYRSKNGPFKSVDDLKNVNGFGDKTVAKMRSELSVSGASSTMMKKEDKPAKAEAKEDKKADKKAAKEAKEVAPKEDKKAGKKAEKESKDAATKDDGAKVDKKAEKKAAADAKKAEKKAAAEAKKAEKDAAKAKKKADKEAKAADKK